MCFAIRTIPGTSEESHRPPKKKAALVNRRIVLPAPKADGISDLLELSVDIYGALPNHKRPDDLRTPEAL